MPYDPLTFCSPNVNLDSFLSSIELVNLHRLQGARTADLLQKFTVKERRAGAVPQHFYKHTESLLVTRKSSVLQVVVDFTATW